MKEIKRKKKEYCPDPDLEFDCPYLDPKTNECTIGNQKEECADFEWDEEEEEEKNNNNTCRGCVYENIDDTTEDISKCVCCKRNVDYAKNDYYTRKEDEGK